MELVGNRFRNLALDGEHIRKIAIIGLGPEMRIVPRIDQLCVHTNAIRRALNTALEQMRDTKLLPDLAQITLRAALVLHHGRAADHF